VTKVAIFGVAAALLIGGAAAAIASWNGDSGPARAAQATKDIWWGEEAAAKVAERIGARKPKQPATTIAQSGAQAPPGTSRVGATRKRATSSGAISNNPRSRCSQSAPAVAEGVDEPAANNGGAAPTAPSETSRDETSSDARGAPQAAERVC
jgi:hypothetical protein